MRWCNSISRLLARGDVLEYQVCQLDAAGVAHNGAVEDHDGSFRQPDTADIQFQIQHGFPAYDARQRPLVQGQLRTVQGGQLEQAGKRRDIALHLRQTGQAPDPEPGSVPVDHFAIHRGDHHALGEVLQYGAELVAAAAELLLYLAPPADVAQRNQPFGRGCGFRRGIGGQLHPDRAAIGPQQSQLAGSISIRLVESLDQQVVLVSILRVDAAVQGSADEFSFAPSQQGSSAEVGSLDQRLLDADGDITHRRELKQIEVAGLRILESAWVLRSSSFCSSNSI